jgi:acyl dehydratase
VPLKVDVLGMVHHYPESFTIGREQVRQYARAIKADDPATFDEHAAAELGHDDIVAPLTFASIFALLVQQDFFRKVDVGMTTMQIVQVDQRFVFHKPLVVGETLSASLEIQSVVERFGADIVVTRSVCVDEKNELVLEAFTTLMGHEGDNSIQVQWDAESGQVMRTAAKD